MYNLQLLAILEKVMGKSYQLKNGENAFYCPFCHHHKKKMQVNFETQKWHCWVCNKGGYKIGILLRKSGAPKHTIKEVLQLLNDYIGYEKDKKETAHDVSLPKEYKPLYIKSDDVIYRNAVHYLRKRRKYVIVIIFAVAAILTPPDPITQIGLGIPLLILYELSIFSVKIVEKRKKDA